jgi:ribosome biogenesis GTPase / thiamine phosphate phosphatase
MGVDDDFSVRRLERYLTLVWDAGAKPIIVLTKADIADTEAIPSIAERLAAVESVAFGSQVLVTSALNGEGIEQLRLLMPTGSCSILLGSSGVGKSTLLNALAGTELQATAAVRGYDGKGRHTTTSRRLVELPWGAFLVDTPGLRELQLWEGEESLANSFPDVEGFALGCRFSDCAHGNEPGCAVRAALEAGDITEERFESWSRLKREMAYLARKTDMTAARAEKDKWKAISRFQKTLYKDRKL